MQVQKFKGYLYAIKSQLTLIGVIEVLQILFLFGFIPSPNTWLGLMNQFLATYGLPVVIIFSFIENFVGLGAYFPGSVAILGAMALTAGDPLRAFITYIAIIIPAVVGNVLSYYVGYLTRSKGLINLSNRSTKSLLVWYGATYWHPQLAAVSAMASGSEGVKFTRYLAHFLPVSFIWSVFWAFLLYNAGRVVAAPGFFVPVFYAYLIGWILWDIRRHYQTTKNSQKVID